MKIANLAFVILSLPIGDHTEETVLPVDKTLTPLTAGERDYIWLCDVFDGNIHEEEIILESLLEEGYLLGQPMEQVKGEAVGLYQPLKKD